MARALDALGVDIIEAGFPIASPADSEAVRQIAGERAAAGHRGARAHAAARTSRKRRARWRPPSASRIHTFLRDLGSAPRPPSCASRATNASTSAVSAVSCARRFTDDVEFSAEDATRSDRDFLCRVIEAVIDAGATTVNLPDTVGYATPDELREFFAEIIAPRAERRPRRSSARTATTISASRSPTASRRSRRRAPGRVRDQRHRRARRQRVARRSS